MTAPDGFAVCFSGHRQKKLPSEPLQRVLQSILLDEIQTAIRDGASIFYSGLATGIDLMAAETVLTQRLLHPQIRLIGVKPFAKQNGTLSDSRNGCRSGHLYQSALPSRLLPAPQSVYDRPQ